MFDPTRKNNARTGLVIIALVIAIILNVVNTPIYRPTPSDWGLAVLVDWIVLGVGFVKVMGK